MVLTKSGFGILQLGMSREHVRALMGSEFRSFDRFKGKECADQFFRPDMTCMYSSERLVDVEIYKLGSTVFCGMELIGAPSDAVIIMLQERGISVTEMDAGYAVGNRFLSLYVPDIGDEGAIVESVYIDLSLLDSGLQNCS